MLEYNRIDTSEEIDVNKTNALKECYICHCWYFLNVGVKNEPFLCNDCHDLLQKAMNFNDVAIVSVKDDKEVLREKARNKYRELSDEEKNIKREYGRNRYYNV